DYTENAYVTRYIREDEKKALHAVAETLSSRGCPAHISEADDPCRVSLEVEVHKPDQLDFLYEIRLREYERPAFTHPSTTPQSEVNDPDKLIYFYRAEVFLQRGGLDVDVYRYGQDELISDVLDHFENYLEFLEAAPDVLPWDMEEHE